MANGYITIEPCTLGEIVEAALEDGFAISDPVYDLSGSLTQCGLIHRDERGCYDLSEQEGDDGWIYVVSMNNPEVSNYDMQQEVEDDSDDGDDDEDEDENEGDRTGV